MFKILLSLSLLGTALSFPFDGRVVNGTDAKEGEYPYIVSYLRIYAQGSKVWDFEAFQSTITLRKHQIEKKRFLQT